MTLRSPRLLLKRQVSETVVRLPGLPQGKGADRGRSVLSAPYDPRHTLDAPDRA